MFGEVSGTYVMFTLCQVKKTNEYHPPFLCFIDLYSTDNKLMGDILTHSLSFLLLALLNCSNSVLVRGVYIDAEEPAGQCVIFPVYYVRLFFQKERTKKQRRLLDALEKMDENNAAPLLPEKKAGTNIPTIVPMGNNTASANARKALELSEMLSEIDTINEKPKNGDHHTIMRSDDV